MKDGQIYLGRVKWENDGVNNDVLFHNEDNVISFNHSAIAYTENEAGWNLRDRGSRNGTSIIIHGNKKLVLTAH